MALKEEIQAQLLPNAFRQNSVTTLFFDLKNQWLFIGSSNASRCEEILIALKEAIDGLQTLPLMPKEDCSKTMTRWLVDNRWPKHFIIEGDCDVLDPEDAKAQIRFVHQNLASSEVLAHLNQGARVRKLTLSWQDRLRFTLDEHFALTRIKFLDVLEEQRQENVTTDAMMVIDVDFSIMALSFSAWVTDLLACFGGVKPVESIVTIEQEAEEIASEEPAFV